MTQLLIIENVHNIDKPSPKAEKNKIVYSPDAEFVVKEKKEKGPHRADIIDPVHAVVQREEFQIFQATPVPVTLQLGVIERSRVDLKYDRMVLNHIHEKQLRHRRFLNSLAKKREKLMNHFNRFARTDFKRNPYAHDRRECGKGRGGG